MNFENHTALQKFDTHARIENIFQRASIGRNKSLTESSRSTKQATKNGLSLVIKL